MSNSTPQRSRSCGWIQAQATGVISSLRTWFVVVACLWIAGLVIGAETAYTSPLGIYTVKVPGTANPNTPVRTYLGIQLLPELRYSGRIGTVTGNAFSLQGVYPHTYFDSPGKVSYLHVLDGSGKGFIVDINQFRASDIACAEDLTQWMQFNTLVQIRPHSSLSDILGTANTFGLGAGLDADSADNVVIWDPDAQHERVYYFHSTRSRWEEKNLVADAANTVFRFPYGFYIVRRSPGTLRIRLSGRPGVNSDLQTNPVLLPVRHGANVFSLPVNLSGSPDAIVRTDGAYPVISGPNAKRSDILTFQEPTTGQQRGPFYHLIRPNLSEWREVGVNDSSASIEPLDLLSTLILWRDGDAGRVLVEGSLDTPTVPRPPLSPDPEPGEIPLTGELVVPKQALGPPGSDFALSFENSENLQTWVTFTPQNSNIVYDLNGDLRVTFTLPAGQRRVFYRAALTAGF